MATNKPADPAALQIKAEKRFKAILGRFERTIGQVSDPEELRAIGDEAANIVVRRTRLGYGAVGVGGARQSLKRLSEAYVEFRKLHSGGWLAETTTPTKSNLTFTGQMLDSVAVLRLSRGAVTIGPTGTRSDPWGHGMRNADVARHVAAGGRPFLGFTSAEFSQLVRFYRLRFGDLLRRNAT